MVRELAAVGEQEVGRDVSTRPDEAAAAARDLEHGRAVPTFGVGAVAERAARAEGDRVAGAKVELAGLYKRAVVPQLELAAAAGAPVADPAELVGAWVCRVRRLPGLDPEAVAVHSDGLPFEPECERDRLHTGDARPCRRRPVPWDYGFFATAASALIPSAASTPASCVRFETPSLR